MELLRPIFDAYWAAHPEEHADLGRLRAFLAAHAPSAYIDRKNFDGHATASAFVVNAAARRVLLIDHKFLKRRLQPGGHIEAGDADPLAAAKREANEEAGVPVDRLASDSGSPIDLDSHYIPANPKKGEAAHYHHDFRYLLRLDGDAELVAQLDEIDGLAWVDIADMASSDPTLARAAKKIAAVLDR